MTKLYKETEIIPITSKIWDRSNHCYLALNEKYFIQVERIENAAYVEYAGNCGMENLTLIGGRDGRRI